MLWTIIRKREELASHAPKPLGLSGEYNLRGQAVLAGVSSSISQGELWKTVRPGIVMTECDGYFDLRSSRRTLATHGAEALMATRFNGECRATIDVRDA